MQRRYEETLCRFSCIFFKPERGESVRCYGFEFLSSLLEGKKLNIDEILNVNIKKFSNKNDGLLYELLCKPCPFLVDSCDFRDKKAGGRHPCGGYIIIDLLLEAGKLTPGMLTDSL